MREIRQSGSEGGVAVTRHPYPYDGAGPLALEHRSDRWSEVPWVGLLPGWVNRNGFIV